MPLRPIINSMFSITTGGEKYILRMTQPLLKDCKFLINSTTAFTTDLKKIAPKYSRFHEAATFDAVLIHVH